MHPHLEVPFAKDRNRTNQIFFKLIESTKLYNENQIDKKLIISVENRLKMNRLNILLDLLAKQLTIKIQIDDL